MLFGFIGMRVFGVSANLMSLGAIDFGMIVDGAVVMMENFVRRREEAGAIMARRSGRGPRCDGPVPPAAKEVARPMTFGVLIIIAVYLPILFLEGLEGRMFRPMAITVCTALFGSLLLALTVVPWLLVTLRRSTGGHRDERWFGAHRAAATAPPRRRMRHRVAPSAVGRGGGRGRRRLVLFIGTEFMPRLDEGAILIETRKLPGDFADRIGRDQHAHRAASSGASPRSRTS